ncbi:hypothetical protein D0Z07_6850 [Hyphodiscus hymeniophilus]|uniref:DUF1223-domain-containing protein n=1 Tax=Hyphodiscus hymeniophilus TaxID=353542 RepID=A0A9P6VGE7_9HELO|nr:hypothetical protein D0Z07_6850 [Hyphodiscus hymeniophilus]
MKDILSIFKGSSPSHSPQTPLPPPYSTSTSTPTTPSTSPPHSLTTIELFQSQGCDSCPPANAFLLKTIPPNDPNHLLLTYEVTYWDYIGWADSFGDKRWDARQRDYAAFLKGADRGRVYTPQVIVDGGATPLGGRGWRDLPSLLARPVNGRVRLDVTTREGKKAVRIAGASERASGSGGDVLVVWYQVQPADVKILRGENRGVTLPHRNVVRDLSVIGQWRGGEEVFDLPAAREGLEKAVLVQAGRGGEILGSCRA